MESSILDSLLVLLTILSFKNSDVGVEIWYLSIVQLSLIWSNQLKN